MDNTEEDNLEDSKLKKLIDDLIEKKLRLSYSSLKGFTSPINFLRHKTKKFVPSKDMVFGSLCDCFLFTPHTFDDDFVVLKSTPTSDNQVAFTKALIEIGSDTKLTTAIIEKEWGKVYSRGSALKTYEELKPYVQGILNKKDIATQDQVDEARAIIDNLRKHKDVTELLESMSEVQRKVEWTDNGWKFLGYLDACSDEDEVILDGKYSKDANPDKFLRDVSNLDYFMQGGMYCYAMKELGWSKPRFKWLVYDKSFNYSIIEMEYSYIMYGIRKYKYLLEKMDEMVKYKQFYKSYGFFKKEFTAVKPAWAKGYELKTDLKPLY
jgi:hypothetical protein